MLTNPQDSGTLGYRLDMIYTTFERIYNNNVFTGLGLGKGETIESWVGVIPYRYGFLGLFFFITFYGSFSIYHYYKAKKFAATDFINAEMAKWVSIWAASVFFSQLSSLGMEFSKLTIFTATMFSASVIIKFPLSISNYYTKGLRT